MPMVQHFVGVILAAAMHVQCLPISPVTLTKTEPVYHNPEHNEGLNGGDMIYLVDSNSLDGRGVALKLQISRWPGGIVPYEFAANISASQSMFIVAQMRAMESLTQVNNTPCIRFRPKTAADLYYITIFNGTGCYATVGFGGNFTTSRYSSLMHGPYGSCMVTGIVQHELSHTLGLFHEQTRPDRDAYVSIRWSNIEASAAFNFEKLSDTLADTLMTPYDYGSVMHYGTYDFAIDRSMPTIIPILNASAYIGQRIQLSPIDIIQIQRYYGCVPIPNVGSTTVALNTTPTSTTAKPLTSLTTITTTVEPLTSITMITTTVKPLASAATRTMIISSFFQRKCVKLYLLHVILPIRLLMMLG